MYGHYQSAGSSYAPPLGAAYGQAGGPAQAGYSAYGAAGQQYAGADRTSPPGVHAIPAGYAGYGYPSQAQPASGQAGWSTDPYGRQVLGGAGQQPLSEKEHERATKEWQKQLKQQQKEAEKSAKAAAKEAEKAAKVREKEVGKQQAAWERGQREREKAEEEEARRLERSSRGKEHQRGSSLSAVASTMGLSRSPSMAAQVPASTSARERRVSNAMGFDKFGDALANAMGGMSLEGRPLDPSTAEAVARRERRGSTAQRSPQPDNRSRAYAAGAAGYGDGAVDPYAPIQTQTTEHERRVAAAQAEAYARAATNAQESYYGQTHADPAAVRAEEERRRTYERLAGGGADPYQRDPAAATRDAGRERERERGEREYDHQRRATSYNPGHGHTVASATAAAAAAAADPYSRSAYDYAGIAGASPGGGAGAAADPYHRSSYGAPPTDPYSRATAVYGAPAAAANAYSPPRGAPPGAYAPPAGAPPTADPYQRSPRAPAAAAAVADPYQRSPRAPTAADPYQRSPSAAHADPYQRSPRYPPAGVPPGAGAVAEAYRRSPYAMGDMPLDADPYVAGASATADSYRRSPGYGAQATVPRGHAAAYSQDDAYGPSRTASESLRSRSAYDRSSAPAAPRGADPRAVDPRLVDPRTADPYAAGPVPRIGDPTYAYGGGRHSEQYAPPPSAGSHTHPASAYESLGGMQVPYPASAATAYHKYLTNPRDFANTEQLHELMSRDGRAAHAPAAPASPPGFHRTPNREQNYQYFEAFMIVDDLDGFYRETPHMPAALVSHDVFHEDWIRFMQDLAFAWSGRTPAPELGRDGRPPHNGVIVADLVDVWNSRFYHPRRVELIVYRGRTPVSARRFLDEYFDPRDNTVKWSLCLRCLDSPTMSGRR